MQLIGDLPLSVLDGLLSYAEEQEIQPLWMANFVISKIANKEAVSYGNFMNAVFGKDMPREKKEKTSPSAIEAQFTGIADAERAKLKKEG